MSEKIEDLIPLLEKLTPRQLEMIKEIATEFIELNQAKDGEE